MEKHIFGYVNFIKGFVYPHLIGCYALIDLHDFPGIQVAVITSELRLQSLLENALITTNLIGFDGEKIDKPPIIGNKPWSVDVVYGLNGVELYNSK